MKIYMEPAIYIEIVDSKIDIIATSGTVDEKEKNNGIGDAGNFSKSRNIDFSSEDTDFGF